MKRIKKKNVPFDIDWRIDPHEYFRISFFSVILLYLVAWSSVIAASMLYLLGIGGFLSIIIHFRDDLFRQSLKFPTTIFAGLFFMLFSLSPGTYGYIAGAYLSTLCVNVLGYFQLNALQRGGCCTW